MLCSRAQQKQSGCCEMTEDRCAGPGSYGHLRSLFKNVVALWRAVLGLQEKELNCLGEKQEGLEKGFSGGNEETSDKSGTWSTALRGLVGGPRGNHKLPHSSCVCHDVPHFPCSWKSTPASNWARLVTFLLVWAQSPVLHPCLYPHLLAGHP